MQYQKLTPGARFAWKRAKAKHRKDYAEMYRTEKEKKTKYCGVHPASLKNISTFKKEK